MNCLILTVIACLLSVTEAKAKYAANTTTTANYNINSRGNWTKVGLGKTKTSPLFALYKETADPIGKINYCWNTRTMSIQSFIFSWYLGSYKSGAATRYRYAEQNSSPTNVRPGGLIKCTSASISLATGDCVTNVYQAYSKSNLTSNVFVFKTKKNKVYTIGNTRNRYNKAQLTNLTLSNHGKCLRGVQGNYRKISNYWYMIDLAFYFDYHPASVFDSMSGGAVAGIVIAVCCCLVCLAAIGYMQNDKSADGTTVGDTHHEVIVEEEKPAYEQGAPPAYPPGQGPPPAYPPGQQPYGQPGMPPAYPPQQQPGMMPMQPMPMMGGMSQQTATTTTTTTSTNQMQMGQPMMM